MKIRVNGQWRDVSSGDLAQILDELELGRVPFATAVNGEFVPAGLRATRTLAEGDRLEILTPMKGG